MNRSRTSRRGFLKTTAALAVAGTTAPYWFSSSSRADEPKKEFVLGAIGVGGQGTGIANGARRFGEIVAVCDVDRGHAERAREAFGGKAEIHDDYRKLLDRKDIQAVTIGTPDHWHVPIALAAVRAGKDVYCEKPLTLTVNEGKLLVKAVLFEGDAGRIYVNRGRITGKPVEDLAASPLPADALKLYASDDHMANFFACIKSRARPISDVVSQHRSVSACHLANISLRLGRKLTWDAAKEEFVDDAEASAMLIRAPRAGFEVGT